MSASYFLDFHYFGSLPYILRNRSISFLYQQFEKEKDGDKKAALNPRNESKPKTGYTIYVSGKTITEDYLKKHFSEFGSIVNVSMEIEKGRGFITFSKTEATERAISEVKLELKVKS